MKFKFLCTIAISFSLAISCLPNVAHAGIIFYEDFENGLSFATEDNWSSNSYGRIVSDPLQGDNALSFSHLRGGGDLWANSISSTTGKFYVTFNYLGTCNTSNCGGFFWNIFTLWVGTTAPYPDVLVDDGTWTTYMVEFTGSSLQFAFEDWSGSGGVAGDAYFDNILISDTSFDESISVPEPATLGLFGIALLAIRRLRQI